MRNFHEEETESLGHNDVARLIPSPEVQHKNAAYGAILSSAEVEAGKPTTPPESPEKSSIRVLLREMSWRKRLTVITASLVNFSSFCCFAVMAPFLPLEAGSKGISSTSVGVIFACFELVMFTASVVLGRYISAIGAKFMYIAGVFITASCSVLFGTLQWCPPGDIFLGMAIACRLVEALGCSMGQTASMAILATEFKDRAATVMGLLETFAGLGLMAGPAIGGVLYELGGFYLPFLVIGIFVALTGVVAALILPNAIEVVPKDRSQLFRHFLKIQTVFVCGICTLTCATVISFIDPILSNQLTAIDPKLATSGSLLGLIFLVMPGLYALLSPPIGYLADTAKYPLPLLIIGNVGFVFAYLLLGPSPLLPIEPKQLWLTIVALAMLGVFIAFCFMPSFAAVAKACVKGGLANDIDLYGLIAGFFGSAFNLGAFFGPLLGGLIVEHVGFEWSTSIVALAPLLNLIVLIIFTIFTYRRRA